MSSSLNSDIKRAVLLRRLEDEASALQKATAIKEHHNRLLMKKETARLEAENRKREEKELEKRFQEAVQARDAKRAQEERFRAATIRNETRRGTNNAVQGLKMLNQEKKEEEKRQKLRNAKEREAIRNAELQRIREIKLEADRRSKAVHSGQDARKAAALASARAVLKENTEIRAYTTKQRQDHIKKAQDFKRENEMRRSLIHQKLEQQRQKDALTREENREAFQNALGTARKERLKENQEIVHQVRASRETATLNSTTPKRVTPCEISTRSLQQKGSLSTQSCTMKEFDEVKSLMKLCALEQGEKLAIAQKAREVQALKAKRVSLISQSKEDIGIACTPTKSSSV